MYYYINHPWHENDNISSLTAGTFAFDINTVDNTKSLNPAITMASPLDAITHIVLFQVKEDLSAVQRRSVSFNPKLSPMCQESKANFGVM